MKVIVMVDRSDGNESIGEMWTDTYIFPIEATLKEVLERINTFKLENVKSLHNVKIQIAQEVEV